MSFLSLIFKWCIFTYLSSYTRNSRQDQNKTVSPSMIIKISSSLHLLVWNKNIWSKKNILSSTLEAGRLQITLTERAQQFWDLIKKLQIQDCKVQEPSTDAQQKKRLSFDNVRSCDRRCCCFITQLWWSREIKKRYSTAALWNLKKRIFKETWVHLMLKK